LISKLCTACYASTAFKPFTSLDILKLVYCSFFHLVMNYGIIFWGNSLHNINIFRLQKRVIRFITRSRPRDTCRKLLKKLKILSFQLQYIFSLLLFAVNNNDQYKLNSEIRNINIMQNSSLYQPLSNLTMCQKGTYYFGIEIFNNLHSDKKRIVSTMLNNLDWH
jgi:hypothetical protein